MWCDSRRFVRGRVYIRYTHVWNQSSKVTAADIQTVCMTLPGCGSRIEEHPMSGILLWIIIMYTKSHSFHLMCIRAGKKLVPFGDIFYFCIAVGYKKIVTIECLQCWKINFVQLINWLRTLVRCCFFPSTPCCLHVFIFLSLISHNITFIVHRFFHRHSNCLLSHKENVTTLHEP